MEADFSGYATKAGLKCSDGRTIMPDAFKHQDTTKVPLVWQHGHNDPENVLGHAILENRIDGVYAYGFFNDSPKAKHTHGLIEHKDITMMSIWANDLIERAGRVLHGAIREVSLVLSGANPGAVIENVTIRHSNDEETVLDDEVIIYTGLSFEHAVTGTANVVPTTSTVGASTSDPTIKDIYDSMTPEQQQVLHYMIGEALSSNQEVSSTNKALAQSGMSDVMTKTMAEMGTTMTDMADKIANGKGDDNMPQVMTDMATLMTNMAQVLANMSAQESSEPPDVLDDTAKPADGTTNTTATHSNTKINDPKGTDVKHNVFENTDKNNKAPVLSHDDMKAIISDASRGGSLKDAVEGYALSHNIENVDVLFPEAQAIGTTPEFLTRRIEWVASLLGALQKSPFSRIKTMAGNLTYDEARAKGYIKGALKKEEFFGVTKRITTPTTIYKKQVLDRDDIVDITDFDVVVWVKGEMRLMLDEELARAILVGDGRDISDEDKINEQNIRPIAKEHELFATTINVNIADANSSISEIVDAIIANRRFYKGTGIPTMFTSETIIAKFLLLRDTLGRRIYTDISEVASELRVQSIVPVELLDDDNSLVAVIVNPIDYVVGATAGGAVSMFDNFDIDYNRQRYLIETRCCGALTRLKSALIIRQVTSTDVAVVAAPPTFDNATGQLTIIDTPNVVYTNVDTGVVMNAAGSPYTVPLGSTINVVSTANAGHYFAVSHDSQWSFSHTVDAVY